ncbi:Uncharacterised protein [Serratia fonticola]|uniref:Uncharacterized protein n=1 Tax=Serratia fonticola TaxID=47917 RepID=A0A4U9UM57_SERFO|nr:Uncharacterised protein [Serratia fonticola]
MSVILDKNMSKTYYKLNVVKITCVQPLESTRKTRLNADSGRSMQRPYL